MLSNKPEWVARRTKVEDLCRQLVALVEMSRAQRRAIDRIVAELRAVAHRAESLPAVRAARSGRPFASDQPDRNEQHEASSQWA
jgi:hypothetical protein